MEDLQILREMELETLQSIFDEEFEVVSSHEWKLEDKDNYALIFKFDDEYPNSRPTVQVRILQFNHKQKHNVENYLVEKLNEKVAEMEGQSMAFPLFECLKDIILTLDDLNNGCFAFIPIDIINSILVNASVRDVVSLGSTSKSMVGKCENPFLWKFFYEIKYYDPSLNNKNTTDFKSLYKVKAEKERVPVWCNYYNEFNTFNYRNAISFVERLGTGDGMLPNENWKDFFIKEMKTKHDITLQKSERNKNDKYEDENTHKGVFTYDNQILGSYELYDAKYFNARFSIAKKLTAYPNQCKYIGKNIGYIGLSFGTENRKYFSSFIIEARGLIWDSIKMEELPSAFILPTYFSYESIEDYDKVNAQNMKSSKKNSTKNLSKGLSNSKLHELKVNFDKKNNLNHIILLTNKLNTTYYKEIIKKVSYERKAGTKFGTIPVEIWVISTQSVTDWLTSRRKFMDICFQQQMSLIGNTDDLFSDSEDDDFDFLQNL